jgi:predicted alpha/beta superfamily hydrolase
MMTSHPALPLLACLLAVASLTTAADAGATTVRIHYDAGQSGIGIRADKGPMSWSKGVAAQAEADRVWSYSWPDKLGEIRMRPTLGADKPAVGGAYRLAPGSTRDIYPFFDAAPGKLSIIANVASPQLGNARSLRIYLPPSYDQNAAKRYPVLYMHDGQNLFDAKSAAYGVAWDIGLAIDRLVASGAMDEVIVVGIDNTPDRMAEYTPCCDPQYGGGRLEAYQRFIVETVKPSIDARLRTLPGKETTAIMGSSLGAIASIGIAQHRPDVFSKAAGVSSSFWWNRKDMIVHPAPRVAVKLYIDAGDTNDGLEDTILMREALLAQGYRPDIDLRFHAAPGASHNETSWAARVALPLIWLFPWDSGAD